MKTCGIAVSAGYDCDNQAATCAALIGAMHGMKGIPRELTTKVAAGQTWEKPFNDVYFYYTRDELPMQNYISDIAERIVNISERAILENGGRKQVRDGETYYTISCDF